MLQYVFQFARTLLMGTIGIFFVSIPFKVPQTSGWFETIFPVLLGAMILYVEVYSWRRLLHDVRSRES